MRATYIRFVTESIDKNSGKRRGIFQAMYALIDKNELRPHELAELRCLEKWFKDKLASPDRFARNRKSNAAPKAISWFKSSATEHLDRMHAICRILNEHDISTEMITSKRPGYIVFEDEHQIAAVPFAETRT